MTENKKKKIDDYYYSIRRFEGLVDVNIIFNGHIYKIADFKYRNQSQFALWQITDAIVEREYQL